MKHENIRSVISKIDKACTVSKHKMLLYIVSGHLCSRGLTCKTTDHRLFITGTFTEMAKDSPMEQIVQLYGRINGVDDNREIVRVVYGMKPDLVQLKRALLYNEVFPKPFSKPQKF